MKMAYLFVGAIAFAAVSGSMAADAGRKLQQYDYVPTCYQPQTLLACGQQPGLECYNAGGSDASCPAYFCCTPPAEGTDPGAGGGGDGNPNPVPYPYVPTCYQPYTDLACGAQAGLDCYNAGGSDEACEAYFCCQPAAAGRRLSQVSGVDASNYQAVADSYTNAAQAIADSYQNEGQNYENAGQPYEDAAQAIADSYQNAGQPYEDAAQATAANYQSYAPPRVPTCYAPYSDLACGAQTGLECYDAGGSDDSCNAYYCCQPAAGGRKLSQVSGVDASNYQAVADSYTNAAQAIADSYQNEGQNYENAGQPYEDAAQAIADSYQNAGQPYEDAAQATAANYQSYAPPRVPTCYAPYSDLACGAQTGLECYDAGGSDDSCNAYYCCQPAAGGRRLSQATGADTSNYEAIAEGFQNGAQFISGGAQAIAQGFQDGAAATAANYQGSAPPRVPTCYAPYSNLACGAQTGLQCYDAGGSDDSCNAYFCCQPQ